MWGNKGTPEFLAKDPADLTPLLECDGLPKGSLWESCAIMQYLCNKHGLDRFYPTDPGERAMVDSAMFYLIGTLYPLLARLRKQGLVETSWRESTSGPPRRYYSLTPSGHESLHQFTSVWSRFRDAVDSTLLGSHHD